MLKKTTALLLVAVMLCVNAVKVFHKHDNCNPLKQATSTATVSASHHCQICDFHFLKDADNSLATILVPSGINYPESNTTINVSASLRLVKTILLRGPPALA